MAVADETMVDRTGREPVAALVAATADINWKQAWQDSVLKPDQSFSLLVFLIIGTAAILSVALHV